jgi:hypothetical protein
LLYALAPSDRIGEVDPPGFVFWLQPLRDDWQPLRSSARVISFISVSLKFIWLLVVADFGYYLPHVVAAFAAVKNHVFSGEEMKSVAFQLAFVCVALRAFDNQRLVSLVSDLTAGFYEVNHDLKIGFVASVIAELGMGNTRLLAPSPSACCACRLRGGSAVLMRITGCSRSRRWISCSASCRGNVSVVFTVAHQLY